MNDLSIDIHHLFGRSICRSVIGTGEMQCSVSILKCAIDWLRAFLNSLNDNDRMVQKNGAHFNAKKYMKKKLNDQNKNWNAQVWRHSHKIIRKNGWRQQVTFQLHEMWSDLALLRYVVSWLSLSMLLPPLLSSFWNSNETKPTKHCYRVQLQRQIKVKKTTNNTTHWDWIGAIDGSMQRLHLSQNTQHRLKKITLFIAKKWKKNNSPNEWKTTPKMEK